MMVFIVQQHIEEDVWCFADYPRYKVSVGMREAVFAAVQRSSS